MRYAYEVQPDETKTVHVFIDEATRAQWIAASTSTRGVLSGNSKEAKAALYRGTVVCASLSEQREVQGEGIRLHK